MTTTIKYTATKMITLRDDNAPEIQNRTAYISRRGLVHIENCAVLTKMMTSLRHPATQITTEGAYAAIESGKLGTCSACMKIAAKRADEFAAVEAEYLAEPVVETAPEAPKGRMVDRLTEFLTAHPGEWVRPRTIERAWGLKGDAHIRATLRRMPNVRKSIDEQGALIFTLAA